MGRRYKLAKSVASSRILGLGKVQLAVFRSLCLKPKISPPFRGCLENCLDKLLYWTFHFHENTWFIERNNQMQNRMCIKTTSTKSEKYFHNKIVRLIRQNWKEISADYLNKLHGMIIKRNQHKRGNMQNSFLRVMFFWLGTRILFLQQNLLC